VAEAGADTVSTRDGTARGAALLGPATVAANALHWLAAVVASRLLGPVAVCVAPLPLLSVLHDLLVAGAGVPGAPLGAALRYAAEVAIAWTLVAPPGIRPPRATAWRRPPAGTWAPLRAELAPALAGVLALTVLANLDLLLARAVLDDVASGRYAVGSVVAEVAFWAPQAVVVVAYPRLAAGGPGAVLRRGAAAVAALGGAVTAGAALTGPWLVPLVFGAAYAPVVAHLRRFGDHPPALATVGASRP